jgi:hypothetical protein
LFRPHYTAPIVGVVILVALQSMRYLMLWRWKGAFIGRWMVVFSIALCVGSFAYFCNDIVVQSRASGQDWSLERARILRQLKTAGGKHLVIVRYGTDHSPHNEWVYNEADINNSSIVWARAMSPTENDKLISYFLIEQYGGWK